MGYTHYWYQQRDLTDEEWSLVCAAARIVTKQHKDILCWESDETDKPPQIDGEVVRFNGKGDEGHETFYFEKAKEARRDYVAQERYDRLGAFNFCKTAHKPYDEAVVVMLAAIKKIAPTAVNLSSDGDGTVFRVKGLAALLRTAKAEKEKHNHEGVQSNEHTVELETGNKVCCPAYPQPCTYVRVVDPMLGEIAYWDSLEWREDPEGVMGAIMGAMSSVNEDA